MTNTIWQLETLNNRQIQQLHEMFQLEWWTQGRTLADVRRMLDNTDIMVAFCEVRTGDLIAFTRVLTDYTYKALLLDMMVRSDYRSIGLGKQLVASVLNHEQLSDVSHVELYCLPEMVPFYRELGFTNQLKPLQFMRRTRR